MRAYALPLSLGSLFPCVHLILWWQSWLLAFFQPAKVKCLFLNCPSKNLRTDFYWTNMGCVLTSQPGTVAVGMESFIWSATLKSEANLRSQNWKELAREVGRELFPQRKSGASTRRKKIYSDRLPSEGDIPSPPSATHPPPPPPHPPGSRPRSGERSCLDGYLWCSSLKEPVLPSPALCGLSCGCSWISRGLCFVHVTSETPVQWSHTYLSCFGWKHRLFGM